MFIKKINQSINGFGHYYKFGNVAGVFEKLDSYIRSQVRRCYKRALRSTPNNSYLETIGLRSLKAIYKGKKPINSQTAKKNYTDRFTAPKPSTNKEAAVMHFYLERLTHQNAQIISATNAVLKELKLLNKNIMGV